MSSLPSPDLGGSASRAQNGEDRKQRCKWSIAEDLVLISAWLNTSKDPLVGNEQRAGTFWKRIAAYYNASPKVIGLAKREQSHCKQRWGKINEGVCKFVGSYDAATKQRTSGQSEDDVLKAAHEIFFNDYKVKFSLEHAWRELRNDQKWCGTYGSRQQSSGSKRKRVGEEQSFQSSASMPSVNGEDEPMARPMGVKAAKTKAKRPMGEEGKNLQELRQMWEIKAKDLIMKDKLSKTKLLDSLLAKTEPLSELEVALKNKLITEMLSMGRETEMEARKPIVCGLSARGIIPPLPQEDTDDDVADSTPTEVEVVEISDEEEEEKDMVELSFEEYRRNMGYLIRVEESVEDIEPEFRRMLKRMEQEEKKLREEKFKVLNSGIKLEVGQSSKGDGKKRKRRS
ncbi:PREDICTED: glutathione S-transferase T3-like [Brassica oleracea var. oleracea]|nr:PREDICTED: glutathione S-transferase T3-like [Brassica oleracea var. oleracea]